MGCYIFMFIIDLMRGWPSCRLPRLNSTVDPLANFEIQGSMCYCNLENIPVTNISY